MKIQMIFLFVALGWGATACDKETRVDDEPAAEAPAPEEPDEPAAKAPVAEETEESDTEYPVQVTPLEHGSLILQAAGKTIAVDPVTSALEASEGDEPKADLILVTHIHGDHLDPEAIKTLRKEGAPVVTPKTVAEKAGEALTDPTIMANGESKSFFEGAVRVEAVEMYNLKRKRDNGEFFHPKGKGNGYVVTVEDVRVYLSGDTECTPEMKALENIDMAFVCMNLPYTMTPEEAAVCVNEFKPKVVVPYHFRGQDPSKLEEFVTAENVEIRMLEWYPNGE